MNAIVIEHVPVAELPPGWRDKHTKSTDAMVTVRIDKDAPATAPAEAFAIDDPLCGMWRDREDKAEVADAAGYMRKLRELRFNDDDTRREG
jgi:hypothetical protein